MEINTELNPTPHSERNHGIELLRIFAMLLAAVLHILKKGGVITASEGNLAAYSTVWLLEAAAYCAVNCYALISGYVGYSDRPKPLRLARCIELWLQVVFLFGDNYNGLLHRGRRFRRRFGFCGRISARDFKTVLVFHGIYRHVFLHSAAECACSQAESPRTCFALHYAYCGFQFV